MADDFNKWVQIKNEAFEQFKYAHDNMLKFTYLTEAEKSTRRMALYEKVAMIAVDRMGISFEELRSKVRSDAMIQRRALITGVLLAMNVRPMQIADIIGRDRTNIYSLCDYHKKHLKESPNYAAKFKKLLKLINEVERVTDNSI